MGTLRNLNIFQLYAIKLKNKSFVPFCDKMPIFYIISNHNVVIEIQIGTEPSDNQYLVVDIGLAAVPIIMIGNCGPHHTLIKQKPSRHLLSFLPLFSVISYLFFQALCYIGVWFYLQAQPW